MPPLTPNSISGNRFRYSDFVLGLLYCVIIFLLSCHHAPPLSKGQNTMNSQNFLLVESLDVQSIVGRFLPEWTPAAPKVVSSGVQYILNTKQDKQRIFLKIAAFRDSSEAIGAMNYITIMTSVGPDRIDHSIGDETRIWGTGSNKTGPILFRRDNVFVSLSSEISSEKTLNFAQRLDSLITAGDPAVRRTAHLSMPQAEMKDPPASLAPGETVEIALHITPLPPSQALLGTDVPRVRPHPGASPSFSYHAPRESGEDTVTLLIATPGNLISRKQILMRIR